MDPQRSKKRPMAFARRVSLFRRQIVESLSPAGLQLLLASSSRISEGQVTSRGRYYGTTMLTIDLESTNEQVQDVQDVSTASRLARHLEQERSAMQQVVRLAVREAGNVAGAPILKPAAEVEIRVQGHRILVDVDLEGNIKVAKKSQTI